MRFVRGFLVVMTLWGAGSGAAQALAQGAQAAQPWTRHVTTAGFTVDRPPGWQAAAAPTDRLDIVSGRCASQAGAICEGQAEIGHSAEYRSNPSGVPYTISERLGRGQTVKLSPHPHAPLALGLAKVKPAAKSSSTQSMVDPTRYSTDAPST